MLLAERRSRAGAALLSTGTLRGGEGSTLVCVAPSHLLLTQWGTMLPELPSAAALVKTVGWPQALARGAGYVSEVEAYFHCYMIWHSQSS